MDKLIKNVVKRSHLTFSFELEQKYRQYMSEHDKTYIRVAFVMFIILYALFSLTDLVLVPHRFILFSIIRFLVVIPAMIATVYATYLPKYPQYSQMILLFVYIIAGIGIDIMLILEPQNIVYYGGLMLVFTAGYFVLHIHTRNALTGGLIILSVYLCGAITQGTDAITLIALSLFLIAENAIGLVGAYQLERMKRNEYLNMIEKIDEISTAQVSTIKALAKLAESRDRETGEHIERVGRLCYALASALPLHYFQSDYEKDAFCHAILEASALHDIGKVGIADAILNKPGRLNEEEFAEMCTHVDIGTATLAKLYEQYPNNYFVKLGIDITQSHHEKWDGTGYPMGLKELQIPLAARIMAIVDVYDALISKRPYKPAYEQSHALAIILGESGKHFDPDLVLYFADLFSPKVGVQHVN